MAAPRGFMFRGRHVVDLDQCGVVGVTMFGRYHYTAARAGLLDHAHAGTMEICFLVKGCQVFRVGGRDHRLRGGDVFVTFPDERHSTGGAPSEKSALYWLGLKVRPQGRAGFLGRDRTTARALTAALLGLGTHHFRGSRKMQEHLDAAATCLRLPESALRPVTLANHVEAFLLEVVRCAHAAPAQPEARTLGPLLDHIRDALDEPLTVPELAARVKLSTARFKVWFKEQTGMPPGEYVARRRIEEAARRLEGGRANVTDVAFDLGFSSSQYFATVFKRFTGQRPSTRRKNVTRPPSTRSDR